MNAQCREGDEHNPLAMRRTPALPPERSRSLEKVKRLVLAVVNMRWRTTSRRDQNVREEKRSAGLRSGENEPDLVSRPSRPGLTLPVHVEFDSGLT